MSEPTRGLSAEDAAAKRVGGTMDLDGTRVRVTLVRQSRIYHVEGTAPEGEAVGCLADYFNAEAGNEMFVVSWTGSEIEFYRGRTIPKSEVASAFQLHSD